MTRPCFPSRSAKHLLLASVGAMAAIAGLRTEATSIAIYNLGRYDGITCDELMAVYKRAYIAVGFKLDDTETKFGSFWMIFTFPNPTDTTKPSGGGSFRFSLPEKKDLSCSAYRQTMGVLGNWEAYNLEEYVAFEKIILAADQKAQALITKKVGAPKSERP